MKRPLLPIAVALCAGCVAGGLAGIGLPWIAAAGVSFCVAIILMLRLGVRPLLLWLPVLGLMAILGATNLCAREEFLPHYHLRNLPHDDERAYYVITGMIAAEPTFGEKRRFFLEPEEIYGRKYWNRISFEIDVETMGDGEKQVPFAGRLKVYVRPRRAPGPAARDNLAALRPGSKITFRAEINRPFEQSNPGGFDFRLYLRRKGIYAVAYFNDLGWARIEEPDGPSLPRFFESVRSGFAGMFYRNLDEDNAAFMCALLLGDRENLPEEMVDSFSVSGAAHFLAISGLHLAIIVSVAYFVLRLLGVPYRTQRVLLILLIIFYASMVGFRPPIMRASIMIVVFFLGQLLGRRSDTLNTLALAAILIVLWDPQQVFSIGFQLSFAAVFSIVIFTKRLADPLIFGPGWLRAKVFGGLRETEFRDYVKLRRIALESAGTLARARHVAVKIVALGLCASIAAWIGTGPLVAHQFGNLSPFLPVVNLFLVGIVYLAITFGFLLMLVSLLGGPFSGSFLPDWLAALPLTEATREITGFFAALSWRGVPQIALGALAAYYAGIFLVPFLRRRRLLRYLPAALIAAAVLIAAWPFCGAPAKFEVAVLDVGHGGASVLRFPDGRVLIYDCGSTRRSDVTTYVVNPYLRYAGITRIDAVVISHPHLDHFSGLSTLLDTRPVGCVVITEYFDEALYPHWARVAEKIREKGVPIVVLREGAGLEGFPEVRFFLTPGLKPPPGGPDSEFTNDTTLAMEVRVEGVSALFTGDMERRALAHLHEARGASLVDFMTAPHHGNRGDSAAIENLLGDCRPRVVAISADRERKWFAGKCRDFGVESYNTSRCGAIIITVRDSEPKIRCFRRCAAER